MTGPDAVATPFAATAFFAGPASLLAGPAFSRLAIDSMLTTEGNRWSANGEPTIYLASDVGVAMAEFGRHNDAAGPVDACVWSVRVELEAVVDLRGEQARAAFDIGRDPAWFLDKDRCRRTAQRLRSSGNFEAAIAPTVAMLDQPTRWNLVILADRLKRPISAAVKPLDPVIAIGPLSRASTVRTRRGATTRPA